MKLLIKAALRTRHHLSLLIVTFLTLFALTIASQLEMFALGMLSNNGTEVTLSKKDTNPLNWIVGKIKQNFQFSNNIKALVVVLLCVALFKAIWLFASRYTTQLLSIRVSRDLRQHYFEHIQALPMSFYQEHNIGSLSTIDAYLTLLYIK